MNDVSMAKGVVVPLATASSKGAENLPQKTEEKSPVVTEQNLQVEKMSVAETAISVAQDDFEKRETSKEKLDNAVASMNDFVQTVQRDLHFSIDNELEQTVVKVIDGGSGDLIRQIPEESFLELARKMHESGELQLVNASG